MRWTHEDALAREGYRRVAGLDEVGRGSLAGPVVAAAVILDRRSKLPGVRDSKLLSEQARRELFGQIVLSAIAYAFGVADAALVDQVNVLQATREAMRCAVLELQIAPDALIIDAVALPAVRLPQRPLIHGDRRCLSVAAASILAKVYRDEMMKEFDGFFPVYRFASNKGYPTPHHRRAVCVAGFSPLHRRTFSVQPPLFDGEA